MLYSATGKLNKAARAFERALMMDRGLAAAHGFAGCNAALLGDGSQTLPAMERAMRLDSAAPANPPRHRAQGTLAEVARRPGAGGRS